MRNAGLDEEQAGITIVERNINNLRYADDTTLMAESEEELKSLLMKVKEESDKASIKLIIQKTKIMASGPMGWWDFMGNRWGDSDRVYLFIYLFFRVYFFFIYFFRLYFFGGSPKSLQIVPEAMKLKDTYSLEEKLWPTLIAY